MKKVEKIRWAYTEKVAVPEEEYWEAKRELLPGEFSKTYVGEGPGRYYRYEPPTDAELNLLLADSSEKNTAVTKNIMLIFLTAAALAFVFLLAG